MKIKQTFAIALLSVSVLQAGFFDHDKEYYDQNPNEAKSKVELCKKALETAFKNGDMQLAQKYNKDVECVAAKKSYNEYQEKARKAKYAAEEKKRKEEQAKKKLAFDMEYKKYYDSFKKSDFDTYSKEEMPCARNFYIAGSYDIKKAKCKAWKDLKKEKAQAQIVYVLKHYQKGALFDYEKKACKTFGLSYSCRVATQAVQAAVEQQKKYYAEHKSLLKRDFNACYDKFIKLWTNNKFTEASKIKDIYKCQMVHRVTNRDISLSLN